MNRWKRRLRPVVLAALLVTLAFGVAACADDADTAEPVSTTDDGTAQAVSTTDGTAQATVVTETVTADAPVTPPVAPATTTAPDDAGGAPAGVVWFADDSGSLVGESRPGAAASVAAALGELAAGPNDASLIPAFPAGSSVLGTDLEGDIVVVEVDEAFVAGYPSGSAAELATIAPIVYTSTELPGVGAVRLESGGVPLSPPTAQLDLSVPLSRGDLPVELIPPEDAP